MRQPPGHAFRHLSWPFGMMNWAEELIVGLNEQRVDTGQASSGLAPILAVPELGQLVLGRDRHWIVADIQGSSPVTP